MKKLPSKGWIAAIAVIVISLILVLLTDNQTEGFNHKQKNSPDSAATQPSHSSQPATVVPAPAVQPQTPAPAPAAQVHPVDDNELPYDPPPFCSISDKLRDVCYRLDCIREPCIPPEIQ